MRCPSELIDTNTLSNLNQSDLIIANLGLQDYQKTLHAMQHYAKTRLDAPDQIWILEHKPIFTRGARSEDCDIKSKLPHSIVDTDRGGKITFHGPGQLIVYFLINTQGNQRLNHFINNLEQTILNILDQLAIQAYTDKKNRGVYVDGCKIASIGLRVKRNNTYHGFSLNVDMDLRPFEYIKPCGIEQNMTQVVNHQPNANMVKVNDICLREIKKQWADNQRIHYWGQYHPT